MLEDVTLGDQGGAPRGWRVDEEFVEVTLKGVELTDEIVEGIARGREPEGEL